MISSFERLIPYFARVKNAFMKNLLLIVLVFVMSIGSVHGQAPIDGFFKGKGNIDLGVGAGYESAKRYFAGTNEIGLERSGFNASIFVGAGITDKLDVFASLPFVSIESQSGLQDGSIFLKYNIHEFKVNSGGMYLALAAGYCAPLSDYETEVSTAIGQQASTFDIRPLLHYQRTDGWFSTAQFAYLMKDEPVPSGVTASLKIGRAMSDIYYDIWYVMQDSEEGRDYRGTPAPDSFRQLTVDFHKVGATVYRPFSEALGVYASAGYVLTGRNVPKAANVNLGVVIKLRD